MRSDVIPCPSRAAYKRGCRCEGCREANSKYTRLRYAGLVQGQKPLVHGTRNAYDRGCTCDACREAKRRYHREFAKMNSKHGTKTRYEKGCRCGRCDCGNPPSDSCRCGKCKLERAYGRTATTPVYDTSYGGLLP